MIQSAQGIAVLVIAHASLMGLCVFYLLWERARRELRQYQLKYQSSSELEEDKRRASITTPIDDTALSMCGHTEFSPKPNPQTKSTTTPTATAKMMAFIILSTRRVYKRLKGASINNEQNPRQETFHTKLNLL